MSTGFNTARVAIFAKRNGISYEEACRRLAKRPRRRKPVAVAPARPLLPKKPLWYLND